MNININGMMAYDDKSYISESPGQSSSTVTALLTSASQAAAISEIPVESASISEERERRSMSILEMGADAER